MKRTNFLYLALSIAFLIGLGACTLKTKRDDLKPAASKNIMEVLESMPEYSTLVEALKITEMDKQLRNSTGPYTIFAPTNAAFQAAGITNLNNVPFTTLMRIVKYHIYMMRITTTTFTPFPATNNLTTNNNFTNTDNIYVTWVPSIADEAPTNEDFWDKYNYAYMGCLNGLSINGIKVTKPDMAATNGVVQGVDRVVLPPTQNLWQYIQANPQLQRLEEAVIRLGLQATLSNSNTSGTGSGNGAFTAFLPTNQAFADAGFPDAASINAAPLATLSRIVQYHVISPANYSGTTGGGAINYRQRLVFPSSVITNGQRFLTLFDPVGYYVTPTLGPNSPELLSRRLTATVDANGNISLNTARPRTTNLFEIAAQNGTANNARVVQSDVMLLNGIGHVIDKVLDFSPQP
jgi:uncharacterized surface protein with fasciclin (FAS1) repeats